MVIVWLFSVIKTLHLVGKLLKTGDVKREVKMHPARNLLRLRK